MPVRTIMVDARSTESTAMPVMKAHSGQSGLIIACDLAPEGGGYDIAIEALVADSSQLEAMVSTLFHYLDVRGQADVIRRALLRYAYQKGILNIGQPADHLTGLDFIKVITILTPEPPLQAG